MSDPFFFGYGSLVNRSTHTYPRATRAEITGYMRAWRGTTLRRVAYLSAVPEAGARIDGLIAAVPGADWSALDARELAYIREPVREIRHGHGTDLEVQVYQVEAEYLTDAEDHPILLSYLDVVVQGYLREFGPAGATRFFDTTRGWGHAVLDDRAAPVYPRHRVLAPQERAFVDDALAARKVKIVTQ